MARADVEKAAFEEVLDVAGAGLDVFEAEPSGQGEGFPPFENAPRTRQRDPHAARRVVLAGGERGAATHGGP